MYAFTLVIKFYYNYNKIMNLLIKKKWSVPVESICKANMIVFANTRAEAIVLASRNMSESMERQIKQAEPNALIKNLVGGTKVVQEKVIEIIEYE